MLCQRGDDRIIWIDTRLVLEVFSCPRGRVVVPGEAGHGRRWSVNIDTTEELVACAEWSFPRSSVRRPLDLPALVTLGLDWFAGQFLAPARLTQYVLPIDVQRTGRDEPDIARTFAQHEHGHLPGARTARDTDLIAEHLIA